MPIYEYECQTCGHTFEIKQGFDDDPLKKCEVCPGKVRKKIHAPAIQFKGSGWYVTDFPSADRKKQIEAEKKAAKAAPVTTDSAK